MIDAEQQDRMGNKTAHWLVEALGGVNIAVIVGMVVAGTYFVAIMKSTQDQLMSRMAAIEASSAQAQRIEIEIAGQKASITALTAQLVKAEATLAGIQDSVRAMDIAVRNMEREKGRP